MSEELNPCLHCGSNDVDKHGWYDGQGNVGPECMGCGATAPNIDVWNTRHTPDGYALVKRADPVSAAKWFAESQGCNWLEYEDEPLDIDEMLQCVVDILKNEDGVVGVGFYHAPDNHVVGSLIDQDKRGEPVTSLNLQFQLLFDNPASIDVIIERLLAAKESLGG